MDLKNGDGRWEMIGISVRVFGEGLLDGKLLIMNSLYAV